MGDVALVGADGEEVVSGLQAEIELKAVALEKLQAECSELEAAPLAPCRLLTARQRAWQEVAPTLGSCLA